MADFSRKQLSLVFTLAAGITAGGVIGVGTLWRQQQTSSAAKLIAQKDVPTIHKNQNEESGQGLILSIPATVMARDGDVVTVRAHAWVGQFLEARVTIDDHDPTTEPRTPYVADVSDTNINVGDSILLHNMRETGVADDGVSVHIAPSIRPRQDVVAGPIPAHVVKLIDGDTVQVVAEIWPGHVVLTDIRVGDIDTPEKKGRAKCAEEAALAEQASAVTQSLIGGKDVFLFNVQFEKYGGRVLGDVRTVEGTSAAQHLITLGLARPYNGGSKSSWCQPAPR